MKLFRSRFHVSLLVVSVSLSAIFLFTNYAVGKQIIQTKSVSTLASKVFINLDTSNAKISGYAPNVSILPGQPLVLRVSAPKAWSIDIFREGFYSGKQVDGKLIKHVGLRSPTRQPHFRFHKANRMIDASDWSNSYSVNSKNWKPGLYVARLNMNKKKGYVPFVVRTPNLKNKTVMIMSFQTMAAYNNWGGYSAYYGRNHFKTTSAQRSTLVSFNRPWGHHGLMQLINNEIGVAQTVDQYGKNVGWTTDYDISMSRSDVSSAKVLITSGHTEYWSPRNREAINRAIKNGKNIMFMGGNNSYWRIRYATAKAPYAPAFFVYKYLPDPLDSKNPSASTHLWRSPPNAQPEGILTAGMYNHSAVWCGTKRFNSQIVNPKWFGFRNLNLKKGVKIDGIASDEMDQVLSHSGAPLTTEIILHAKFQCVDGEKINHQLGYDMTYYTTPTHAAVWSAGTVAWGCALSRFCRNQKKLSSNTRNFVMNVTKNILETFSQSGVSAKYPSLPNVQKIYPGIDVKLRK